MSVVDDRKIDIKIAEWLGITEIQEWTAGDCSSWLGYSPVTSLLYGRHLESIPFYSVDVRAAWYVEEHIKELGLEDKYIDCLATIVKADLYLESEEFLMVHASPLQRCLAALKAAGL